MRNRASACRMTQRQSIYTNLFYTNLFHIDLFNLSKLIQFIQTCSVYKLIACRMTARGPGAQRRVAEPQRVAAGRLLLPRSPPPPPACPIRASILPARGEGSRLTVAALPSFPRPRAPRGRTAPAGCGAASARARRAARRVIPGRCLAGAACTLPLSWWAAAPRAGGSVQPLGASVWPHGLDRDRRGAVLAAQESAHGPERSAAAAAAAAESGRWRIPLTWTRRRRRRRARRAAAARPCRRAPGPSRAAADRRRRRRGSAARSGRRRGGWPAAPRACGREGGAAHRLALGPSRGGIRRGPWRRGGCAPRRLSGSGRRPVGPAPAPLRTRPLDRAAARRARSAPPAGWNQHSVCSETSALLTSCGGRRDCRPASPGAGGTRATAQACSFMCALLGPGRAGRRRRRQRGGGAPRGGCLGLALRSGGRAGRGQRRPAAPAGP